MPITWNAEADAKLLMAILHTSESKPNHAAIAQYMGPECTTSAIQHRLQRLKEKAKPGSDDAVAKTNGGNGDASDQNPSPMTPEKPVRKRGRPPKKKAEEQGSPVKKQDTGEAKSEGSKEEA